MKRTIDIPRLGILQTILIALGVVLVLEGIWALATGYTLPSRMGHGRLVKPDEPWKFLLSGIPILYVGWTWRKLVARMKKKRPNQPPEPTPTAVTPPAAQESAPAIVVAHP